MQDQQYILTPRMNEFICRVAGSFLDSPIFPTDTSTANSSARNTQQASRKQLMGPGQGNERRREKGQGGHNPEPKQFGGLPTLDGFHFHKSVMIKGQPAEEWKYKHEVRTFA